MNDYETRMLKQYVHEDECDKICRTVIRRVIQQLPPQSITVYRGHRSSREIRPTDWFSTSKSKRIAKEDFSSGQCCIFKIHLVNVPILDVYQYIPRGRVGDEDEIIVLGGGTFYKDSAMRNSGFKDLGHGEFETWYTMTPPPPSASVVPSRSVNLDQIVKDLKEFNEFIDSEADIDSFQSGLTKEQRAFVFNKLKHGGKRRKTRKRKSRSNK